MSQTTFALCQSEAQANIDFQMSSKTRIAVDTLRMLAPSSNMAMGVLAHGASHEQLSIAASLNGPSMTRSQIRSIEQMSAMTLIASKFE